MQNRLYFISPINDRAFFIRRQQNNEQAKGWLDSDRGEKWEDRSSIIESGAIEKRLFVNKDWWVVQNQIWVRMNHILAQIFCYLTLINWLIKKILILMFSNDLNP